MSRTTDFSHVESIALIDWTLKTETPLCIKSGTTSAYSRSTGLDFHTKSTGHASEGTVSDFYFDARFEGHGTIQTVFRIPASSIRGALRNFTIKRLVPEAFQGTSLFSKNDDQDGEDAVVEVALLKQAVQMPGWHLIQNLFGLAADTSDDELENETVAGRLQVISDHIVLNTSDLNNTDSPLSAVSRSPLDRATRGTKNRGLHSFMELGEGYEFDVCLRVVNPTCEDLGFAVFWEKSINQGLIRLGGLSSVGKGRLHVKNSKVRICCSDPGEFIPLGHDLPDASGQDRTDILADVFPVHTLAWDKAHQAHYLAKLKDHYDRLERNRGSYNA